MTVDPNLPCTEDFLCDPAQRIAGILGELVDWHP